MGNKMDGLSKVGRGALGGRVVVTVTVGTNVGEGELVVVWTMVGEGTNRGRIVGLEPADVLANVGASVGANVGTGVGVPVADTGTQSVDRSLWH